MPALVSALNRVDLPTFGNPTMPHFKAMVRTAVQEKRAILRAAPSPPATPGEARPLWRGRGEKRNSAWHGQAGEQGTCLRGHQHLGQQESLTMAATQLLEPFQLRLGFDTFGDHLLAEKAAE